MGGGAGKTSRKSSNWNGYPKKRCESVGCKKRGRHIVDGKLLCKKCVNGE